MCRKEYITHIYSGDRYVRQPYLTLCAYSDGRRACQNLREYDLGVRYHDNPSEQPSRMQPPPSHRRPPSSTQQRADALRPARTFPVRSGHPPPAPTAPQVPQRSEGTDQRRQRQTIIFQTGGHSSSKPSEKPQRRSSVRRDSFSHPPRSPTQDRRSGREDFDSPPHRRTFDPRYRPPTPPSTEPRSTGSKRRSIVIGHERPQGSGQEKTPPYSPKRESPEPKKTQTQDTTETSRHGCREERWAQTPQHASHASQDSAEMEKIKRENADLKAQLSELQQDVRKLKLGASPAPKRATPSPKFKTEVRAPGTLRQETYRDASREQIVERQPRYSGDGRSTRPSTQSGETHTSSSRSSVIENESQEEIEHVGTRHKRRKDDSKDKGKAKKY